MRVETDDLKLVSEYSGMSFSELMELDCYTYKLLFKDAYIDKLRQSEKGVEYLENCWILTQSNPDRNTLRDKFKG